MEEKMFELATTFCWSYFTHLSQSCLFLSVREITCPPRGVGWTVSPIITLLQVTLNTQQLYEILVCFSEWWRSHRQRYTQHGGTDPRINLLQSFSKSIMSFMAIYGQGHHLQSCLNGCIRGGDITKPWYTRMVLRLSVVGSGTLYDSSAAIPAPLLSHLGWLLCSQSLNCSQSLQQSPAFITTLGYVFL